MRTECTCGAVIVDEPAPDGLVSHGLCPLCYRRALEDLLARMTDRELAASLATAGSDEDEAEWTVLVEQEIGRRS